MRCRIKYGEIGYLDVERIPLADSELEFIKADNAKESSKGLGGVAATFLWFGLPLGPLGWWFGGIFLVWLFPFIHPVLASVLGALLVITAVTCVFVFAGPNPLEKSLQEDADSGSCMILTGRFTHAAHVFASTDTVVALACGNKTLLAHGEWWMCPGRDFGPFGKWNIAQETQGCQFRFKVLEKSGKVLSVDFSGASLFKELEAIEDMPPGIEANVPLAEFGISYIDSPLESLLTVRMLDAHERGRLRTSDSQECSIEVHAMSLTEPESSAVRSEYRMSRIGDAGCAILLPAIPVTLFLLVVLIPFVTVYHSWWVAPIIGFVIGVALAMTIFRFSKDYIDRYRADVRSRRCLHIKGNTNLAVMAHLDGGYSLSVIALDCGSKTLLANRTQPVREPKRVSAIGRWEVETTFPCSEFELKVLEKSGRVIFARLSGTPLSIGREVKLKPVLGPYLSSEFQVFVIDAALRDLLVLDDTGAAL